MAAADRDDGIGRRDDDEIAGNAQGGWNGDLHIFVGFRRVRSGQDADRLASDPRRPATGRAHYATHAAGHHAGSAAGQQLADLLGPLEDPLSLRATRVAVADDRHVGGRAGRGRSVIACRPP